MRLIKYVVGSTNPIDCSNAFNLPLSCVLKSAHLSCHCCFLDHPLSVHVSTVITSPHTHTIPYPGDLKSLGTPGLKAGWMQDTVNALQPQPQQSAKFCYRHTDINNDWTFTTDKSRHRILL